MAFANVKRKVIPHAEREEKGAKVFTSGGEGGRGEDGGENRGWCFRKKKGRDEDFTYAGLRRGRGGFNAHFKKG